MVFGFLNLDKPKGITSRDAVNTIQRLSRKLKVGHCGTLDPLATGVLVIGVGPATRLTQFVQDASKTYRGTFELGVESDTEDILGQIRKVDFDGQVTEADVNQLLPTFLGTIEQTPPAFSALKVNGRRAYDLARQGRPVELKPRPIQIHELRLVEFEYPRLVLEVVCGSGTYIRSLGRDLGQQLGCGAVMSDLRRTAIGPFRVCDAWSPEQCSVNTLAEQIQPPQIALESLPSIVISDPQRDGLAFGTPIDLPNQPKEPLMAAIDHQDRLLAILRRIGDQTYSPKINFWKYWSSVSLT